MSLLRLQNAFVAALRVSPNTDFESLRARAVPEWDSVGQVELVTELEATFGVTLSTDDVFDLDSFVKAKEILGRHGVDVSS
jgi:acyl carrier protein